MTKAAANEFLPTDLGASTPLLLGAIGLMVVTTFIVWLLGRKTSIISSGGAMFFNLFFIFIVSTSMLTHNLIGISANVRNVEANILQAYDVDEVKDIPRTIDITEPTEIMVTKDSKTQKVTLTQDAETYEPTLSFPKADFDVKELRK